MQNEPIAKGVWPTMVTPFTNSNQVDYFALEQLVEWYINQGVAGLFAVCQSSEMFFLTLDERTSIAKFVVEKARGRVQVIASGHISESMEDQVTELQAIAASGVQAIVLVSNRLAKQDESDEVWKRNAETLLSAIPDIAFGIYECPFPYKRLISPELLAWCESTGRFTFLKDTCCHTGHIQEKLNAVRGGGLNIYNANTATLLETLKIGVQGYSGIMANFHPDLYVWLTRHFEDQPERAERLQHFLGMSSVIESQYYPVNAKYYLSLEGLPIGLHTRTKDHNLLTYSNRREVEQLFALTAEYRERGVCPTI
ncbi:dihydrodipicolinate synthase family protein [Paenibacillus radicis (ex Xue et al. 2023)]|uniref:Dihydrodipicolinate synthase family protein n=1 Tax=Paenibacillus radicis (ex Xue et al. 2023) TaxID=2972489 RepID=A0ABT1YR81_9BACL|nr:dihydrodipicolinate synthase family protein [Paenibacillus radicis (ex Xue et al. 2023)]MCR8635694.1 dihydrodipicolinate synthase family protein [Paenibacillus radicis (ex Xue et al. 2023)]